MRNGNTLLRFIAAFFLCFMAGNASAEFTKAQKADQNYPNILKNGGFERGLYSWTASGLTASLQTSTPLDGIAYASLSGTAGNTWSSEDATVPNGYGFARCKAQWLMSGSAGTVTVSVIDGTPSTVASQIYNMNNLSYQRGVIKFPCLAGAGTLKFRVTLGTATSIGLDAVYLGLDENDPTEYRVENLINGGDAESGGNGFALYDDGATATPIDGTGGTAGALGYPTITATLGNIISGSQTFEVAKSAANGQGEGISYDFKLSNRSALFSSLVSLSFDYYATSTNFATGDVLVYVYDVDTATLITPQFVSCGGGSTPAIAFSGANKTCHAQLAFLSTTSDDYRLIFHVATTNATAWTIRLDNIYAGEHKSAVGAAVGSVTSFSPAMTSVSVNVSDNLGSWQRVNDTMVIKGYVQWNGTDTTGGIVPVLPSGYTIDTSKLLGGRQAIGSWYFRDSSAAATANSWSGTVYCNSSGSFAMGAANGNGSVSGSTPFPVTIATGDELSYIISIPISQFAGTTASFGENSVEYISFDGSNTVYGPAGSLVPTITASAVATSTDHTMSPMSPLQATDQLYLEIQKSGTGPWVGVSGLGGAGDYVPITRQNTGSGIRFYGVGLRKSGSNIVVEFGNAGATTSGTTYGAVGANYPSSAGDRYRVVKHKAGVPVGFGLADATNPGLYRAGNAPGITSDAVSCTGCVGEVIESEINSNVAYTAGANNFQQLRTITLTPGHWAIQGSSNFLRGATTLGTSFAQTAISTTTATTGATSTGRWLTQYKPNADSAGSNTTSYVPGGTVYVAAGTTQAYFLNVAVDATGGSPVFRGWLAATRVR